MNLQEARKRIPELDGLSDDAALSVIQQVYYPDIDRSTLASRLGVKVAAPPAPERTWGQAIGDTAVQLAEGVNTTLGAIPSIVAPDGSMAGFFRDNAGYWRDKQSDVLKGRIAATDQRIQEAGKEGVMSQIGTAVSEYWNDPAQAARLVATNLPSMAATLGTGALAGAAAKGVAAARGMGAAGEAALAAQYGTRTAMATNAALNAGGARSEAYEDLKRAALAQDMSPEQAEQAALDGSVMPGVVGGVAGAVSGKLGLEKALLGQPGAGAGTALRRAAGAFGAELAGEQIEEVSPKLTTNYEAGKIDPVRSLTDDLGRTMVETTIGAGPGAVVAGGIEGMNNPAQTAADAIRANEKVPESGTLTRAVNAGVEAKAQAVEASAQPPALGARLTDTDMGTMLGGGGMAGRADPLAGALGMNNEAQASSITNVANVAERRPPMPASDAARMLDEARNRGLDLAVVEHPSGGFVLVPPTWVTPDMAAQGEARLNETIARMQQADAAPVERAPRTRTDGVGLNLQTDPVLNYVDNLRSVNTPAARAYVRDFDAGRITRADVQQRMQAERGLTPEQRIARAAAEAPAKTDPVAERLRSAAAQGMATPAPTDILNPAGEPFKTRMAADRAAKKTPGAVVPVEGGFVVRPQEPVNVQDVPQAPEVPQAAPAISPPGQAPQAVGAQPAGPAAGVPAEGAGAVEAAGVSGEFADLFDEQGRPRFSNAQSVKDFKERTGLGQDGVRAIQAAIQEGRHITVDEARQADLAGQERRKAALEQSKADSEAEAQAAKQNSAKPTEPSKVLGDYEIPGIEGVTNRVRVLQRGGRIEAIGLEEGTAHNDLSRLIQSGQTVEQALAALYGDHGPNEAPNPSRVKRAGQPTSAAAPAAAAGLTDGAPTANTGAQAAPAGGAQGAAPAEPEFTTIKTVYGDSVTVRTADLNGDKQRLRQYTKDGKSKAVPAIHRDNLDLTGDKRKASAKEDADNPFFNVITTKDGSTFANQAAASRELNRLAMGETHEVVAASEVQDGAQGFVIRRKLADAIGTSVNTEQGAIKTGANQVAELSLDDQLKQVNDELANQGPVQNANTRSKRDQIRTAIAERDFPAILKAVDGDVGSAEAINQALQFAGDEPKAKVIERVLKNRGISSEYRQRWAERLMDGQVDELDAEMQSYEDRAGVERRPNLKNGPSSANTPVAPPAPVPSNIPSAQARWDVFMPAERREMLRAAGYTDADQARALSGLKWVELSESVRKAVDAAHKKQVSADAPAPSPGVVNVPQAIEAALDADMQAQKARITRLRNAATADGMSLDDKRQAQTQLKGAELTLQTMRRTRFDAEDAAIKAIEQKDMAPFAEHITFFKTEKALQELIGAAKPQAAAPAPKKKPSADQTRAKADLMAALADLGDILGKNTRLNITPEQEVKLLPVLTRVLDAAFRLGYHKFKDAAKFALDQIRANLGDEAADALTLDHLQGAYIAMAGGKQGADTKRAVIDVETKAEIEAHEAKTADEAQEDAAATPDAKTLTESLYQAIGAGNMPKDNPALKKLVEAFDGKPADPARMKQAQEELETAIAMSARDIVAKGQNDKATFDELLRLYESQPSLNIRTSTSVANQAYSTPAPLAFIASRLAGITRNTVAHEPTGGTGMLLIGADPKKALVNELNDLRISALKAQGFTPTQMDAATMRLVPEGTRPDAVVTNPPFGSVKDSDGKPVKVKVDGYSIGQIDHLIAARALETMKDDGKATLILGANKVAGGLSTDDRIFFNWLYSHYNVVGHFEVEGDLYARQGAGWPVRVITINGRQKSGKLSPVAGTIQRADNWSQVYEQFTQSLNAAAKPATVEVGGGPAVAIDAPGAPGGSRPQGSTGRAGNVAGTSPRVVPDRAKPAAEPVAPVPDEQRLNAQSFVPQPQPGQDPAGAERPAKPVGTTAVAAAPAAAGNEFQSPYVPRSARKDEGVLIPSNMAQPTQDALNRLEDAVGDIDEFARKELGYESTEALHNALMGLQVDSVATAIYQIKQNKAVVIADQTGIGKGRQAASIIRWAARNGMTPVFVSVKPSLFTDMYGDLADIGTNDVEPFILNSTEWVSGADGEKLFANKPSTHRAAIQSIVDNAALPQGRNALFMTYSQINTANLQRQALMALAPNAVFVLDESHNAAGDSGTGDFMISVLKEARGVTYLSATYAKRPDNMPLYFKTDIGDAAADSEGLANAMAAGGLPLQTVVSNNLVKAGQMFRRERSYDGVSIASTFDTANRQLHERLSDEATEALRAIVSADKLFHSVFVKSMDKALKAEGSKVQDNAGNQVSAGVQHTEFSSVVHNFVRQMLLGLKAQTAADEAIASLKRGEKPIIAVENTMGSFLSEYAAQNNINQGDSLGAFDYRTVLSRALERSRVINVVLPTGDKSKQNIPLSQLDPITRKAYDHAQEVIDSLAIDIPVSPIDWMRAEIVRAGFSVAEITGRDLAVDYSNQRKPVLSAIDLTEQRDKVASTRRFNGGELDALILNVAGSTGISLHASEKFADQRQRHMIVAQAAGDINIFMQMLGRVHRTGQVRLPKYTILSVDLPTEKRPTAVLSRKMKSLNANTSSNTESATSVKTADILNKYGDQIVNQYLVDNLALANQLDVDDLLSSDGERVTDDIARKATGRLALQPIEVQRAFYEDVEAQYDALIEYLNKTNQNDLEPRTFDFDAKEVRAEILFDGPNKTTPFGEDAVYGEYSIKAQGMAMKPEEIQAAIAEGLQGKTPAEHVSEMLANLDSQYKQFIEKLAEASREKAAVANADGEYDNTKHEAIGDTLFINKSIESAGLARQMGADFLRSHAIGKTFRVEINSEPYNAVITNVRSTHKTTGNPYSLSKIQITIAVNGALRSITVPATQFRKIEVSSIAPAFRIETLFKEQPANQRETAKIVTGNLLAAYGEIKGARGTIISFTKADGTIEQGILLPKLFDFSKNTQGDYRLRSGADALKFLQKSTNKDIGRFGIATRDGQVRVLPRGDGVQVRVPKSKAQGARYFLDKNLIAVAGDFVSSANAMVANVDDAASAKKVLDMLMDKQALYALPSMADEAKSMAAKPGADGGTASFSRAPSAAPSRADSNARNAATQLLVDGLKAKWTRAPEIIVARNMQDDQIPQEVRDYDALLKSQGATGEPRGFIYKGKVYLLSDQLKGPQQIAEVLFHEALGHYGLRGAFGDGLTPILKQLGALRRKEVVAKAREYGLFNKDALGGLDAAAASDSQIWAAMSNKQRLDAAEEVLAEMAQTQPTIGFVQRAIAAIRNWLRANVPGFKNLKLTDADIVQAYILPARAYVTRSQETGAQSLERAMRDAGFSRAPASDQTQTENFRRWFGDSKAVDADGKPLVVYHGTGADFSEFSASKIGSAWGADTVGFFFTDSAKTASSYATSGGPTLQRDDGANIIPAYIRISRPVTVEELEAFTGESGLADAYESPIELMDERRDDIMSMLLGNEQDGWSIDKDSKPSVNNTHDGVIFSFGGSTLVVAVDPAQIKSAIGNNGNFDPADPDIRFSRADIEDSANFKRWFGDSKVVDAEGKPLVVYHGTPEGGFSNFAPTQKGKRTNHSADDVGYHFTSDPGYADAYSEGYKLESIEEYRRMFGNEPAGTKMPPGASTYPVYLSLQNPMTVGPSMQINKALIEQAIAAGHDGIVADMGGAREYVAFRPEQVKSAIGNNGNFDPEDDRINFSRTTEAAKAVGDAIKSVTATNIKQKAGFKLTDYLGIGLQALGRRQIVDIYGDMLPLGEYNRLVQQMEADKNEGSAEADQLVNRWAKLEDEGKLADLMHDATLAQIDPAEDFVEGDDKGKYLELQRKYNLLSDDAKKVYADTRDAYKAHHAKVRSAIKERIERSEIKGERKAALLKQMDDEFFKAIKGVYFPLARFGQYAVTVKGPDGKVESVSRAETKAEAEALRSNLLAAFPRDKGFTVGRVMLSKDFIADRDAVGRGFMTELYQVLDQQNMDAAQRAELEDTLGQLYLSSLPDLSWAKHGIHRKGTPGFSQDARRAFAQNMFHGARYLAKLRYSDLMQDELAAMQKHVDDRREVEDFDQNSAQRVVDEMSKRHESLMNPKSNPLSTALTSLGFVFHLGLSPASAMVNLSQTALVAYPIMGAKWGFGKASAALLKASAEAAKGKNDITGSLNEDERAAYDEAVRAGTIDVTMAHDLAGIAQGEDAGVMWKIRPVMRWASFMFHHAEQFNRQVTFVAAYRLAREAGADHKAAFEQATKATYDGHFDYGAANRPRIMQGNVAKVLLLFKQYGQNMIYTLARNAQQAIKGKSPEVRSQARKALGGLLATHAAAAGVLGLPMVTTLLAAASMIGGDDDEPWDAKVALQNMLADTLGQKPAEVLAHGLSRLTPWDISGRVGLDKLIFPDVQEGLEGQRLGEAAMAAALGPVAGIGINVLKGLQDMSQGQYARGLEAMMPAALRGPLKAIRYESEGVQDKTGVVIKDDVSLAGVAGQFLGFSPSEVRNATEGKSAVIQQDRALGERRQELLTKAARATMAKDAEARAEAMKEIERFNQKNPTRRITPLNVLQSVRNRQKRIDQAEGGVYLPKNRRDAMEAGRFAVVE